MRGESLGTRCPPARPVWPWSPRRVYTRLIANRGTSNGSSLMFPASSVHYVWNFMRLAKRRFTPIILSIVIMAGCGPASSEAATRDPKKSQAALRRGEHLDEAGKPQEAIA